MQVRASDVEPDQLRRLLSDDIAENQARSVRRYFLTRFAIVGVFIWVFSWPVPLLPHTVLWTLAAAVVFAWGLMSPPRHAPISSKRRTHRH